SGASVRAGVPFTILAAAVAVPLTPGIACTRVRPAPALQFHCVPSAPVDGNIAMMGAVAVPLIDIAAAAVVAKVTPCCSCRIVPCGIGVLTSPVKLALPVAATGPLRLAPLSAPQ